MIVGAQYYRPPNPPRDDWERDLRRMREAGFDTVKLWACWSWMQPTPGAIDFDDLDTLFDLAHRAGLGVVVNTILENAPYWLAAAHPSAHYQDQDQRVVRLTAAMNTPGGGWPGLCFDNPGVADAASAFLTAVVERYRDHPALRVWDVWNEPHLEPASYFPDRLYCYCDASVAAFVAGLRERYGSLDALNAAWARRFSSWDQAEPPRVFEAVPDMLDWRGHWFRTLTSWLDRRCAVVRAADPEHPVMTHVALSGFTGQLATHTLDEYALASTVDIFGTSSFPTWLMGDDHVEHFFNLDTARGAAVGKPFWQAELQGGRGRRDGPRSTPHPDPSTVALWMWNALASGASGVVFWQWRPELLGPESPGYGLCTPDGSLTPRVAAASAFAAATRSLEGAVAAPGSIGLLVSRASALHAFATDRTMNLYRDAVLGAYRLLLDADLPVEVLHADRIADAGVPDHIESLYWPMPSVAGSPLAAKLKAFVHRGGTLLSEAAPGEHDDLGWRRPSVPGAGLAELFGARQVDADIATEVEVGGLRGAWQRETLTVAGGDVLATFDDGTPGIVRRGGAVLVATYPSLAYAQTRDASTRSTLTALLAPTHQRILTWSDPTPGLIHRVLTLPSGTRVVVAVNWTAEDQKATLAGDPVTVPARSGRVLPDVEA
ncbi:beta-galactosidase/beta-galactosidase [Asanoa hainanensis]|uniref:Beta-galactosidase/beta-galactosidase n=1 Tax=Asanoa hainanensis TaxID=560556 RepID=A0A239P0P7_9ACTN|nr:beta-galactosidase [Asanoa hainanensis]SNT60701.1 beta-galactosidase/beta-galactosidase [Asanoa hainanensis]